MGSTDDKYNNCVYHCLKTVLGDSLPWPKPSDLKKYLRLEFNDKIDIGLIPIIERKLKNVQINVYGDETYTSPIISNKVINLKLINGHCTLKENSFTKNIKHKVAFEEKTILLYNKASFMGFDGKTTREISKVELKRIYDNETNYIIINKEINNLCFEEEYKSLIEKAEALKNASNGAINLYKTGNNVETALNLFDKFNKMYHPELIDQLEAEFITGAFTGGLIFYLSLIHI